MLDRNGLKTWTIIKGFLWQSFFVWMIIAGADRLWWLHSGGGIESSIGKSFFAQAGILCNDAASVEVKLRREGDRVTAVYRCPAAKDFTGGLWPFYEVRESEKTRAYIRDITGEVADAM